MNVTKPRRMFTLNDLRKAVMAGQVAHIKKIVNELKSRDVDFDSIKTWAAKFNQVRGGAYQEAVDALE